MDTIALLVVLAPVVATVSRLVLAWLALRGSEPAERPAILRALALCLYRPLRGRRP